MAELVSILIPAYNAEHWVRDAMLSSINQTWPNKEIIVVDDGSSDNTYKVAKALESKTVKVVTQPNAGACGARNNAFKLAQGDYIQWLDADDLLHPEKISLQLSRRDGGRDSLTLLTCAWGNFFFCQDRAKFVPDSLWQDLSPVDWMVAKFTDSVWMNPSSWLVSRRLTELSGPWDNKLSLSGDDDGEYICRIITNSQLVKFVPEAKSYYRLGSFESLSWRSVEKAPEPLYLSICQCIAHLRSLEDSSRTRQACKIFLQNRVSNFNPNHAKIIEKCSILAQELGGDLIIPSPSRKFMFVSKILGSEMAKELKWSLWKQKLVFLRNWDRVLHTFGKT